jgi:hypothetical protein
MLNKTNQKRIYGNTLVVPALVAFYAVSSKCRGAEKAKETTLNITGMKVELQITSNSTEKELNAEKIFLKKSII